VVDLAGIGQLLCQIRTEKGMTTEHVARELHLQIRQISALEAGDFSGLGGPVFVKGYLRACARLYAVDGDRLVDLYDALSPQQPKSYFPSALASAETMVLKSGRRDGKLWLLVLFVAVTALLVFLLLQWQRAGMVFPFAVLQPEAGVVDTASAESSLPASTEPAGLASSAAAPAPETPILAGQLIAGQTQPAGQAPMPTEQTLPEQALAGQEPAQQAGETGNAGNAGDAQALQDAVLHIEFVDDCWVQLKTDDGKILHEAVHKKGEIFDMPVRTPLHVWLGRALAVNISYNGTVVPVPAKPGFQSVQFVLGDDISPGETE
jgi:cytoskeleton protein RodZ